MLFGSGRTQIGSSGGVDAEPEQTYQLPHLPKSAVNHAI